MAVERGSSTPSSSTECLHGLTERIPIFFAWRYKLHSSWHWSAVNKFSTASLTFTQQSTYGGYINIPVYNVVGLSHSTTWKHSTISLLCTSFSKSSMKHWRPEISYSPTVHETRDSGEIPDQKLLNRSLAWPDRSPVLLSARRQISKRRSVWLRETSTDIYIVCPFWEILVTCLLCNVGTFSATDMEVKPN